MMSKRTMMTVALLLLMVCVARAGAKYIFYFIGDGMGLGHVNTAQIYNRDVLKNPPLLMMKFPIASQCVTYSANSPITDSAAAGTALSTGTKTLNGMVGENPDSMAVYSVATRLKDSGYGIGIGSTVAGNDATPAAFYGHAHYRKHNDVLNADALKCSYNFLGGPMWRGTAGKDGLMTGDWKRNFEKAGFSVYEGYDQYAKAKDMKEQVLLLSANPQGEQVGYTIDSIPGALTAAQLTQACLDQLMRTSPDKFFMMIEGGNIDWAAHANDGGAVIKEILNYQQAIDIAYKFYLQHPTETLIVITADHDTGGMAFGREDNQKKGNIGLIDFQRISKDRFSDWCKTFINGNKSITWPEMQQFIKDNLGMYGAIDVTVEEDAEMRQAYDQAFVKRTAKNEKTLYNDFNAFAVKVFDIFNKKAGIGWTTTYHTGNMVPVYAIGVGCDLFTGVQNNVEIPRKILEATKL